MLSIVAYLFEFDWLPGNDPEPRFVKEFFELGRGTPKLDTLVEFCVEKNYVNNVNDKIASCERIPSGLSVYCSQLYCLYMCFGARLCCNLKDDQFKLYFLCNSMIRFISEVTTYFHNTGRVYCSKAYCTNHMNWKNYSTRPSGEWFSCFYPAC